MARDGLAAWKRDKAGDDGDMPGRGRGVATPTPGSRVVHVLSVVLTAQECPTSLLP